MSPSTLTVGVDQVPLALPADTFRTVGTGVGVGGFTVPLNPDAYFITTVSSPNQPPLANSFATLSASGDGSAAFTLASGFPATFVGHTLQHAYGVFDASTLALVFVSNAEPLSLTP